MDNLTTLTQFTSTLGKQFPEYQEGINSFLTSLNFPDSLIIKDVHLTIIEDKLFIWDFILNTDDPDSLEDFTDDPDSYITITIIPGSSTLYRLTYYSYC